jgi:plastocyanin
VDQNQLTFSIVNMPSWATLITGTGRLQGTPTNANAGTYAGIIIRVTDGIATTSLPAFSITVTAANTAPTISGMPATSVVAGTAYSFTPTASDVNSGDTLTFSIANMPSWATFSTTTGRLQGTPSASNVGSFAGITIRVSDGTATTALAAFSIAVTAANTAPTISGTPATSVVSGSAYSFTPTASDVDSGNTLTFSIVSMPSWATFNTTTGRLQGTPGASNVGSYTGITIRVTDGTATTSLAAFSITVTAANTAPTISGTPPTSAVAGSAYTFTPTASDVNSGDTLTFSIVNMPSWATFNATTGRLQGTPGAGDVGSYAGITIRVSDGTATTSLAAFGITVTQIGNGTATVSWTAPTENADGSPLTNLAGYHIVYGTSPTALSQQIDVASPGITSYVISSLNSGTYYFAVKAYNVPGSESDLSAVVSKTFP